MNLSSSCFISSGPQHPGVVRGPGGAKLLLQTHTCPNFPPSPGQPLRSTQAGTPSLLSTSTMEGCTGRVLCDMGLTVSTACLRSPGVDKPCAQHPTGLSPTAYMAVVPHAGAAWVLTMAWRAWGSWNHWWVPRPGSGSSVSFSDTVQPWKCCEIMAWSSRGPLQLSL